MNVVHRAAVVVRIALGLLFIYASHSKILDPAAFSRTVYYYRLLPAEAVNVVAIVLPWIEVLVGVFLVVGFKLRGAALLASASMVIFLAAMTSALARGLNIDCGCFSADGGHGVDSTRVLQDVGLLAAAVFVYWSAIANRTPDRHPIASSPIQENS
jgi:uncharacterized membrane protein YphA (DoxX/SURF4 family)